MFKSNFYKKIVITILMIVTVISADFANIFVKTAHAVINEEINYQGKLTNASNVAVADGPYAMEFKLYTTLSGGSPIWTETLTGADRPQVTNGIFSVMLGSTTPFTGVNFNQTLYLGVKIEADTEMIPRKIIGSVPSAFVAKTANALEGLSSSQFLRSDAQNATSSNSTFLNVLQTGTGKIAEFFGNVSQSVFSILSNGNVGIGTSSPYAALSVVGVSGVVADHYTSTSTTNASVFPYASTTALTIAGRVYTSDATVSNTITLANLNGPLQAVNGLMSATTTISTAFGGTGISTLPSYGNILVGQSNGSYVLTATSSLGLSSFAYPFTVATNYGVTNQATTGIAWFQNGLNASSTSHFNNNITLDTNGLTIGRASVAGYPLLVAANNNSIQFDTFNNFILSGQGTTNVVQLQNLQGDLLITNGVAGGAKLRLLPSSGDVYFENTIAGALIFRNGVSATERMRISATGNIGMGTTTPYAKLSVASTVVGSTTLAISPMSGQTANILDLYNTSGTLTSVINASGNWGIGTTSPYARLSVVGEIVAQNLTATSTTLSSFISSKLGIGTNAPEVKLHIATSSTGVSTLVKLQATTAATNDATTIDFSISSSGATTGRIANQRNNYFISGDSDLIFSTFKGGTGLIESFRAISNGNVGIGTTSPNWKLSVAGIGSFDDYVRASYFTSTSTTQASTFPYASTTALSATTICITTDCRTSWPNGSPYSFTPTTNYAVTNQATTGIAWFQNGLNASSTSNFVNASTTVLSANTICIVTDCKSAWPSGSSQWTTVGSDISYSSGNVIIGAKTDSASTGDSAYTLLNSAAGTFGAQTSRDKVASAVVYNGKLFVSTSETDLAGVYRYDGGTTWTLVTSSTLGKAISGDSAADVDAFVMTVFDGELWIGSQNGSATAAVYRSSTADTASAGDNFTMVNSARGTINGTTQTGISDMVVYNGFLVVATQKANLAEIARYEGGTTFTRINATVGKVAAETSAVTDGFSMVVCNNLLWAGTITADNTAVVGAYALNTTGVFVGANPVAGGGFGADTGVSDITSMACWNGSVYVSGNKTAGSAGGIYNFKLGAPPTTAAATNWIRINTALGKLRTADSANINSFVLRQYKGRLYAGSQTANAASAGALFEYNGIPLGDFTLMTTGALGTFGSQTSIDSVSVMQEFNETLYVGTDDLTNGLASIYTWTKSAENSYALEFDSGSSNYGAISFVGNVQPNSNDGHYGSFQFSHGVSLTSGSFDYAEDYPSYDETLSPGDILEVDSNTPEFIRKANGENSIVGIYSTNPGLRLQNTTNTVYTGEKWIPVALVGRVPVKVSNENGPIKIGDSLTLSSTPGVAMKASKSGKIIGHALESYTGNSTQSDTSTSTASYSEGKIKVSINNSYSLGSKLSDLLPKTDKDGVEVKYDQNNTGDSLLSLFIKNRIATSTLKLSEIYTDRIGSSLEIVSPNIKTDILQTNTISTNKNSDNISILLNNGGLLSIFNNSSTTSESQTLGNKIPSITFDALGNAFFAGEIKADKIIGNNILAKEVLANQFTKISEDITGLIASSSADIWGSIYQNVSTLSSMMASSSALQASSTVLELRVLALEDITKGLSFNGVTVMNGALTLDSIGSATSTLSIISDVQFFGRPYFTTDTAGFAIVKKGSRKVEITFDKEYLEQPIVNTSISLNEASSTDQATTTAEEIFNQDIRFLITNKSTKGFTIMLNKAVAGDVQFSWIALAVKGAKTFESPVVSSEPVVEEPTVNTNPVSNTATNTPDINTTSTVSTESAEVISTSTPASTIVETSVPETTNTANISSIFIEEPVAPVESVVPVVPVAPTEPVASAEPIVSETTPVVNDPVPTLEN